MKSSNGVAMYVWPRVRGIEEQVLDRRGAILFYEIDDVNICCHHRCSMGGVWHINTVLMIYEFDYGWIFLVLFGIVKVYRVERGAEQPNAFSNLTRSHFLLFLLTLLLTYDYYSDL